MQIQNGDNGSSLVLRWAHFDMNEMISLIVTYEITPSSWSAADALWPYGTIYSYGFDT